MQISRGMEEERRKIFVHSFIENLNSSLSAITKKLKFPKTTVCKVIKRYKETMSIKRQKHQRQKTAARDKKLELKVRRSIKKKPWPLG